MAKSLTFLTLPRPLSIHAVDFLGDVDLARFGQASKAALEVAKGASYSHQRWRARSLTWENVSILEVTRAVHALNERVIVEFEKISAKESKDLRPLTTKAILKYISEQARKVQEPSYRWGCLRALITHTYHQQFMRSQFHELIGTFLKRQDSAAVFLFASTDKGGLGATGLEDVKKYYSWAIHHKLKEIFNILIAHRCPWDKATFKKAIAIWKEEPDYLKALLSLPAEGAAATNRSLWMWEHTIIHADQTGDLTLLDYLEKIQFPTPTKLDLKANTNAIFIAIMRIKDPAVAKRFIEVTNRQ